MLNVDAERGSSGDSSDRQCSKCWSTGTADSGLLRCNTTKQDVRVPGQLYSLTKLRLLMLLIDTACDVIETDLSLLALLFMPSPQTQSSLVGVSACHSCDKDVTEVILKQSLQVTWLSAGRHEEYCAGEGKQSRKNTAVTAHWCKLCRFSC